MNELIKTTDLTSMTFGDTYVEVFELNGIVYFNPRDVGICLGLGDSAVRMVTAKMNDKQVKLLTNSDVKDIDIRKFNNAGENFLTESGVYKLIFRSNKPNAEKFQDWVTDEVLPTIRKTGGTYMTQEHIEKALTNPDFIIEMAMRIKIANKERDEAIRTKAEIGSRREATAMATASVKARENEKLKEEIGDSKRYKQVKAIPWLSDYFNLKISSVYSQIGRSLSKIAKALGRDPKEIEDSKWGKVKAYDVDVIDNFKGLVSEDPNILAKYRKA